MRDYSFERVQSTMPCIRPTVRDIRAVDAPLERNYERFISNRTSSDYRNSTGSLLSRLGGGFGWKSKAFGLGAKPARRLGRGAFPWIGGRRGGDDRGLPRRTVTCPRRGGRDHRGRRKCAGAIRNSPIGVIGIFDSPLRTGWSAIRKSGIRFSCKIARPSREARAGHDVMVFLFEVIPL